MAYQTGTLTGSYIKLDGSPHTGAVEIRPDNLHGNTVRDPDGNSVLVGPFAGRSAVALVAGEFSVDLPASDDDTLDPSGVTYSVYVRLDATGSTQKTVKGVFITGGDTVDMADLVSVSPADPSYQERVNEATVSATAAAASQAAAATSASEASGSAATASTAATAASGSATAATGSATAAASSAASITPASLAANPAFVTAYAASLNSNFAYLPQVYGAKANGRTLSDAAMTSGSAILTSTTATFAAGDVGKLITVAGAAAGGEVLAGTIASRQSATQVTLSVSAATTVANACATYGSDDTTAIQSAIAAAGVTGGSVYFPAGLYLASATLVVPGGVRLLGAGWDFSDPTIAPPHLGSVISAGATIAGPLVQLGTTADSNPGHTAASTESISIDGRNLATSGVRMMARRNELRNSQVYWGSSYGVQMSGQNGKIRGGVVAQANRGDCVILDNGGDQKIYDAELRQPGSTGATVRFATVAGGSSDYLVRGCHMYAGQNGTGLPAQGLIVADATNGSCFNISIDNNIIEGIIGPEILLNCSSAVALRSVKITNNQFFNFNASSTYPVVQVSGTGAPVSVLMEGNTAEGAGAGAAAYKSLVDFAQGSSTARFVVANNVGMYVATVTSGTFQSGLYQRGNHIYNGSATVRSDNAGLISFNGNGSTKSFTIPHGLDGAPRAYQVTPTSADSIGFSVGSDATNLTVQFVTAPPTGTTNVQFGWQANR